jgi:hypothetical protein
MDVVNERSTYILTVSFLDEDGAAVVPASASYRIDDVGSDAGIRDDTEISPLAAEVDLVLTAGDTSILDETHPYETRRVTVSWTFLTAASPSLLGTGTTEHLVNVANLKGVTTPSPA